MGIEENKETVRRYIKEILNDLDYSHFNEIAHEDFFGMGGTIKNVKDHEEYFKNQRQQVPDIRNELQDMIAEGDRVLAISTVSFTDTNGYAGHDPTNKKIAVKVLAIYTLREKKIVKGEILTDALTMFQQLGFYPPLPEENKKV